MIKVSCLCPTYNRASGQLHLVEEALSSFLRQDYPAKELVILNDTPGQTLRYDHPQVRIVNLDYRLPTLGDKRNALAELAKGEVLFPWDDDDISLPWRLSRTIELLGDADYFNPRVYWYLDNNGLHHDHSIGYAVNASAYRKSAWNAVGGSDSVSLGEDAAIDAKLRKRSTPTGPRMPLEDWFYIYRWGVSSYHLSGEANDAFYGDIAGRPITAGEYLLKPHWQQDYQAMTSIHAKVVRYFGINLGATQLAPAA